MHYCSTTALQTKMLRKAWQKGDAKKRSLAAQGNGCCSSWTCLQNELGYLLMLNTALAATQNKLTEAATAT